MERYQQRVDEELMLKSQQIFKKYEDLEKLEFQRQIEKYEKAQRRITSNEIRNLYTE